MLEQLSPLGPAACAIARSVHEAEFVWDRADSGKVESSRMSLSKKLRTGYGIDSKLMAYALLAGGSQASPPQDGVHQRRLANIGTTCREVSENIRIALEATCLQL